MVILTTFGLDCPLMQPERSQIPFVVELRLVGTTVKMRSFVDGTLSLFVDGILDILPSNVGDQLKSNIIKRSRTSYLIKHINSRISLTSIMLSILIMATTISFVYGEGQLDLGDYHSCIVTSSTSGGAMCWGFNNVRQLGDGTSTERSTPTSVSGLTSGVSSISSGGGHGCAVLTTGGVKCWGHNVYGQLGDGTYGGFASTPVSVSGLTSVSSISIGGYHSCALLTTGEMKCWGSNGYGQLGNNTVLSIRTTPASVSGLTSGVSAITAGDTHTCALLTTGAVKCWGYNADGQIGDATQNNAYTPVSVYGLTSGVSAICAGWAHTCALISGGIKCWGSNDVGQVGDGTQYSDKLIPTSVYGMISGVSAISCGYSHTCAILSSTGGLKCWGYSGYGQIGDGSTTDRLVPVNVWGLTSGVSLVSCGRGHTCAILSTGVVKCWGYNGYGQVGDGTSGLYADKKSAQ